MPLTPSQQKRADHKEKFRKIGAAISAFSKRNSEDRDYHTGQESQFHICTAAVQDKEISSRLCGPKMKTQQFIRTIPAIKAQLKKI